jgi:hypothetical protein
MFSSALASVPAPQTRVAVAPRTVNLVVIHCSATASGKPLQRGLPGQVGYQNAAQIINAWHAERGFLRSAAARAALNPHLPSIGYHYVVDLDGQVFTGRGLDEAGAHAKDHNAASAGICLVGGAEREAQFTPAQWKALKNLVTTLQYQLRVQPVPPRRNGRQVLDGVCGHRDLSPDLNTDGVIAPNEWLKTCPGFSVAGWLKNGLEPHSQNVLALPASLHAPLLAPKAAP